MNEVLDFLMSAFPWIAIGLFVAVWEMYSGNTSSGATWLVLGVCNAVLNFANIQNSENEKEEKKEK